MSEALPELLPAAVVQVGSSTAAIALHGTQRAIQLGDVSPVPLAPDSLLGLTVVGDEPVLVVDLGALERNGSSSARAEGPPARAVCFLCREDGESVVLAGMQVRAVARLRVSRLRPRSTGLEGLARASAEWRGASIPVLSVSTILDAVTGEIGNGVPRDGGRS